MNDNTIGEIFVLAISEGREGEILQTADYHIHVPATMMEDNVIKVECVGQPRIQHRTLGYRRGFARSLSFQSVALPVNLYNSLMQCLNNHRLIFFVQDEMGKMQVLYTPRRRNQIDITGEDPAHHTVSAEPCDGPNYTPISLLVHADGQPMTKSELEQYLINE